MGLEEAMSPRSCSITWHSFSPWHNLSKLSSAHGLPKELLLVVKVVQVVFYVSTSNHSIFRKNHFFSLFGAEGDAWPVTGWARPLCVSMSKTVETWILQERRTSAVAYREAGLPKNRVHAAKLSLSANPIVRYDAIG